MVSSIDVLLSSAYLALSWGKVINLEIGLEAGLTCECLINNLFLAEALLAFVSPNIVNLVDAAYDAGLISQIIQASFGTVEADLFFIPNKWLILWAAGEVIGGWSLEDFDLIVTFTDGPVVPVEECKVILKIATIQIDQASSLFVYLYIAEVPIQGLIDWFEVLLGHVEQFIEIGGNESTIWTSRLVGL